MNAVTTIVCIFLAALLWTQVKGLKVISMILSVILAGGLLFLFFTSEIRNRMETNLMNKAFRSLFATIEAGNHDELIESYQELKQTTAEDQLLEIHTWFCVIHTAERKASEPGN